MNIAQNTMTESIRGRGRRENKPSIGFKIVNIHNQLVCWMCVYGWCVFVRLILIYLISYHMKINDKEKCIKMYRIAKAIEQKTLLLFFR